jgi:hypothetical protein
MRLKLSPSYFDLVTDVLATMKDMPNMTRSLSMRHHTCSPASPGVGTRLKASAGPTKTYPPKVQQPGQRARPQREPWDQLTWMRRHPSGANCTRQMTMTDKSAATTKLVIGGTRSTKSIELYGEKKSRSRMMNQMRQWLSKRLTIWCLSFEVLWHPYP